MVPIGELSEYAKRGLPTAVKGIQVLVLQGVNLNSSVREQSAVFFTPLQRFIMTALELIACE
jgi:hypothetical protein